MKTFNFVDYLRRALFGLIEVKDKRLKTGGGDQQYFKIILNQIRICHNIETDSANLSGFLGKQKILC